MLVTKAYIVRQIQILNAIKPKHNNLSSVLFNSYNTISSLTSLLLFANKSLYYLNMI